MVVDAVSKLLKALFKEALNGIPTRVKQVLAVIFLALILGVFGLTSFVNFLATLLRPTT